MTHPMVVRSYLFVPGTRPERFGKALASGAQAVIVDLEDAVAPAEKDRARTAVAGALSPGAPVLLRINGAGTPWFESDLELAAHPGIAGIVLPKTEGTAEIDAVRRACGNDKPVLPMIESARGLWHALTIASAPAVQRLLFGSLDYQVDLALTDDDLVHARSQLVLVSRVAGIGAPVDGVTPAIDDVDALRRETRRARALGFGAKLCIHPRQIETVNALFRPTADEVAWAERVIAADATAKGAAVAVDGKMVDRPVLLKAQGILAEAQSPQGAETRSST